MQGKKNVNYANLLEVVQHTAGQGPLLEAVLLTVTLLPNPTKRLIGCWISPLTALQLLKLEPP